MENLSTDQLAREQSGGMCEALLALKPQVWARCGKKPIEVHHRLPRSRGGLLLDDAGETYHLMALCREHHKHAHEDNAAFHTGLMIAGKVTTHWDGEPHYVGSDPVLTARWGPMGVRRVREEVSGAEHGKRLRGET